MTNAKPRIRIGSDGSNARLVGEVSRPRSDSLYMKGEQSPFFFGWNPALRDASDDVSIAWSAAAARAVDAIHNSGWLAGAIEQSIAAIAGTGLRLAAKPDMPWTEKVLADWRRKVESRWSSWANNPYECDLHGRHSIGQITAQALRSWYATGEVVATIPWRRRAGAVSRTKLQLIPSHRLVQTTLPMEGVIQGIRTDVDGLPTGYRFAVKNKFTGDSEIEVQARDKFGRTAVIHVFDGMPGQNRGITPLAPALLILRQYDQLSNATLTATMIQAIFAATVESQAPTNEVLDALRDEGEQGIASGSFEDLLAAKAGWYENTKIDLGRAGKIAHLFPGEQLKFNANKHPNDTYEAFAKFLLREVAKCLGLTFEAFTGDRTGATYSSERMGTAENWPIVMYRRDAICGRLLQAVYECWLEEEIDAGRIEFPGGIDAYVANRSAAARCEWRGPAKPTADDLKTAKAQEVALRIGSTTLQKVCSDNGEDWEDVQEQQAVEMKNRERLKLPTPEYAVDADAAEMAMTQDPKGAAA